ncbi:MAG: hypothetical protein NVS2B7_39070 [Herpetosiphon sp.]
MYTGGDGALRVYPSYLVTNGNATMCGGGAPVAVSVGLAVGVTMVAAVVPIGVAVSALIVLVADGVLVRVGVGGRRIGLTDGIILQHAVVAVDHEQGTGAVECHTSRRKAWCCRGSLQCW